MQTAFQRIMNILVISALILFSLTYLVKAAYVGDGFFVDDTYYYMVAAMNFVEHGFLSLDSVTHTNGYHPVWTGVCIAVAWVVKLFGGTHNHMAMSIAMVEAIFYVLTLASLGFFYSKLSDEKPNRALTFFTLAAILSYPLVNWMFRLGMESTLTALIMVWLVYFLIRERWFALSLIMALLVMTRLDTLVFLIFPTLMLLLIRPDFSLLRPIVTGFPTALVTAGYLYYNHLTFGHIKPINGVLRSSFPIPTPHWTFPLDPVANVHDIYGAIKLFLMPNTLLLVVLAVVGIGLMLLGPVRERLRSIDRLFLITGTLLVLNLILFQKWSKGIEQWYFAAPLILLILGYGGMFRALLNMVNPTWLRALLVTVPLSGLAYVAFGMSLNTTGNAEISSIVSLTLAGLIPLVAIVSLLIKVEPIKPIIMAMGFSALLVSATVHALTLSQDHRTDAALLDKFTQCVTDNVAPDAFVAGTDIGGTAFKSQRHFVNLDGVVNNFVYQEYLRDKRLADYLTMKNVQYIAVTLSENPTFSPYRDIENMYKSRIAPEAVRNEPYESVPFYVYSYMYNNFSDEIPLFQRNEVCRSEVYMGGNNPSVDMLFRIEASVSDTPKPATDSTHEPANNTEPTG
ncbi:MAG: hypothetical protein HQL54_03590 [Magnetococcales bacterium]|nr:hypothetical protein [Magnetococcales bacterium]